MTEKPATRLAQAGRRRDWTLGVVNPPVFHASTCIFETLDEMEAATKSPNDRLYYGRRGTPTSWALEAAMTELEPGCAGTRLTPSGVSAIAAALLSFARDGAHMLISDNAYEPSRGFAEGVLRPLGVEVEYFDPMIGGDIAAQLRPQTSAVLCESPGSLTFEVCDLPAIAACAHQVGARVILDNSWATPLLYNGYAHGADVVVHALTKYVVGHSDAMLGSIGGNDQVWNGVQATVHRLGLCAGPDDAYLGLRGLRTLGVRLAAHDRAARNIARWLERHPLVERVLHPAFASCPGHDVWRRDFAGASGLFSVLLKQNGRAKVAAMVDHMAHFKMGFSWGGYESLILPVRMAGARSATRWDAPGALLRLHVGLEDEADLIADLDAGLARFAAAA